MARYKVMYVDYCHASGEAKAIEIADKELSNNRTMFSRCATAERVAEVEDLNSTEVKRSQDFDEWFDPRADSYQYGAEGPALDAWNEQQKKITALERRARIAERAADYAECQLGVIRNWRVNFAREIDSKMEDRNESWR